MKETTVAIIGSGFAGLGMAIRLRQAGITDLVVLEAAGAVGGTWRDNTYPGAACDIPSHLYSYSFEPNPAWTHRFARQPEIWDYLERCATKYGVRPHLWFGAAVKEARFDETAARWTLRCHDGRELRARFVVFATGGLRDPRYPNLPGLDSFGGELMHSARWRPEVQLEGKRVGVLGTGASAVQVVPELAGRVGELHLFQRTPAWVRPRGDRPFSAEERRRFARSPLRMRAERLRTYLALEANYPLFFRRDTLAGRAAAWALARNVRRVVADPALAQALTPSYAVGCKRVLLSDDYLPAVARPDVTLHTTAVARVQAGGVVLRDGREVGLDVLVCCTGFQVDAPLGELEVFGRGGVSLGERWRARPTAYLGVSVAEFPNAFVLLGPNSGLGHNSVVVMIEAQLGYVLKGIQATLRASEAATVEVRAEVQRAFVEEVDARHAALVWASGCQSWYLADGGENFTVWPGSTLYYLWRTRRFDAACYRIG